MLANEINRRLKDAGVSQLAIADRIGVKPSAVSQVVTGRSRSAAIEEAVATSLGLTPAELWPQWYGGPAAEDPHSRLGLLDVDLHAVIEWAYWQAASARGDNPILPLAAKHLGRLYNRCAEQLTRSATAEAKKAIAVKEIQYLVDSEALPRFDLKATTELRAEVAAAPVFENNFHGSGPVTNNQLPTAAAVKIDMRSMRGRKGG